MWVRLLTLQVMCQTSTVRRNTPHATTPAAKFAAPAASVQASATANDTAAKSTTCPP
jgi:hypothetical protein